MPRPVRAVASGVLICALSLGVTACGGDDDKPSATDPSTAASTSPPTTPSVAVSNEPGSQLSPAPGLPSDFPTNEIPLLPGPVTQPLGTGSSGEEGRKGWVLEVAVARDRKSCFKEAVAALIARGFELRGGPIPSAANIEGLYGNAEYNVIVTATAKGSGCSLSYEVGQAGSKADE